MSRKSLFKRYDIYFIIKYLNLSWIPIIFFENFFFGFIEIYFSFLYRIKMFENIVNYLYNQSSTFVLIYFKNHEDRIKRKRYRVLATLLGKNLQFRFETTKNHLCLTSYHFMVSFFMIPETFSKQNSLY